ncbi:VOC family protein [Streptomyces sp. WMMB 322]|uniref:VOC family protein n=1 Tax=Streptomyces sp. WMMB 322 TaxID=1286821 RepID=UPI0006E2B207|nr:VOC family protein [Streptomyces sp. WMMB 322]SCK39953.1 Glyoxalase/Bleomycin resistance protein/Dioxygenase superfamily protein [Streptomyces sp. WMMB 322]
MIEETGWPEGLAVGATRTGRRCNRYQESVAFYRDVVGLPLVHSSGTGPDGFGCAIFGLPGTPATYELVQALEPVPVDRHEELVLYFPGEAARDVVARRITEAGYQPAEQYRYWDLNDAVTFLDPDGRELVLAPWVFGEQTPPMRKRSGRPAGTGG